MNIRRSREVFCLAGMVFALCFVPALLAAQQSARSNELVQEGFQLLNKKKYSKAIKVLSEANDLEDGASVAAMLGLSRAFNATHDEENAAKFAREILNLSEFVDVRAWAHIELARALGSGKSYDGAVTAAAVEGVREYLAVQPTGAPSEQARVRLCQIRGQLPPENPYALSRDPEYADGERPLDPAQYPGELVGPRNLLTPEPVIRAAPGPRVEGLWQIDITAVIDRDGCVRKLRNADGSNSPEDESVKKTIAGWVFEPAVLGGKTVSAIYNNTVSFRRE